MAQLRVFGVFIFEDGDIGCTACSKHFNEFLKDFGYTAEMDDGKPVHCMTCANEFLDGKLNLYRYKFSDGEMTIGFVGCKTHIKLLFDRLEAMKR